MATKFEFAIDEVVQLRGTLPTGPVKDIQIVDGKVMYLLHWINDEGMNHHRWFDEDSLMRIEKPIKI
jgi:uncharacterized protein YodC (DUF2158 family)